METSTRPLQFGDVLLLQFGDGLLIILVGLIQLHLWTTFVICCLDYVSPLMWIFCGLLSGFHVVGKVHNEPRFANNIPSALHALSMIHADL